MGETSQDFTLAWRKLLLTFGAREKRLAFARRKIAQMEKRLHDLLTTLGREAPVEREDGLQFLPLRGREALHDRFPLAKDLLSFGTQRVPPLQGLTDLRLPFAWLALEPHRIGEHALLLLRRQVADERKQADGVGPSRLNSRHERILSRLDRWSRRVDSGMRRLNLPRAGGRGMA